MQSSLEERELCRRDLTFSCDLSGTPLSNLILDLASQPQVSPEDSKVLKALSLRKGDFVRDVAYGALIGFVKTILISPCVCVGWHGERWYNDWRFASLAPFM